MGWSCGPLPSPGGPGTVAMSPPFTTRAWGPVLPCWVGRGSPPFARRSRASYLLALCSLPPPGGFGAPSLPPGAGTGSPVSARRSLPLEVSLESPPFSSGVRALSPCLGQREVLSLLQEGPKHFPKGRRWPGYLPSAMRSQSPEPPRWCGCGVSSYCQRGRGPVPPHCGGYRFLFL